MQSVDQQAAAQGCIRRTHGKRRRHRDAGIRTAADGGAYGHRRLLEDGRRTGCRATTDGSGRRRTLDRRKAASGGGDTGTDGGG